VLEQNDMSERDANHSNEPAPLVIDGGTGQPGQSSNTVLADADLDRSVHPAADLFPPLDNDAFERLVTDIREHGLRQPITLDAENRILDGRHRLRACRVAGIEPRFKPWDERGSPLEYVVSMNLQRRHLDQSQRAMIAARIASMRQGERTDLSQNCQKTSQPQAARLLNVSGRSVTAARKVLTEGDPALVEAVDRGAVPVNTAADLTGLARREQHDVVLQGSRAAREAAKRLRSPSFTTSNRGRVDVEPLRLTRDQKRFIEDALRAWVREHDPFDYGINFDELVRTLGIRFGL
jgi:hypothetical protein